MSEVARLLSIFVLMMVSIPCHAEWKERRAGLKEMHRVGEFRIFYSSVGRDALPNLRDSNKNQVPDYVERIAMELVAARDVFSTQYLLSHPLRSRRYSGRAEFIDVNLLAFPLSANGPRHGIAYDELSSFDRDVDSGRRVRVLAIDLSNDLGAKNKSCAHELFHLYQNGYTFFKNRWFTEGTARWMEDPTAPRLEGAQLPRGASDLQSLFGKTYDAAPFWTSVSAKVDPDGGGRMFIKTFLEELDQADDALASVRQTKNWSESDQRSEDNNRWIWQALLKTLEHPVFRDQQDAEIRRLSGIRP